MQYFWQVIMSGSHMASEYDQVHEIVQEAGMGRSLGEN